MNRVLNGGLGEGCRCPQKSRRPWHSILHSWSQAVHTHQALLEKLWLFCKCEVTISQMHFSQSLTLWLHSSHLLHLKSPLKFSCSPRVQAHAHPHERVQSSLCPSPPARLPSPSSVPFQATCVNYLNGLPCLGAGGGVRVPAVHAHLYSAVVGSQFPSKQFTRPVD